MRSHIHNLRLLYLASVDTSPRDIYPLWVALSFKLNLLLLIRPYAPD